MNIRTALMWVLRNFLRIAILSIVVGLLIFRATELMMTLNTTSYIEAYYISQGLDIPDAFRRISGQELAWGILHLVLSLFMLVAAFLTIYAFTLLRRKDNGNILSAEKHSPFIITLRELAVLLSISTPASIIGTLFSMVLVRSPQNFEFRVFSAAQMLGEGLPLAEFWFVWMLIGCLILSMLTGVVSIKRLGL